MLFVCHPQILRKHCLQFLLGVKMALRGTENNSYTKFCGDKQRALWYVMVFSGVVNWSVSWKMIPYSRPKLSDLYTPSQSKLLENHTFYSGIYPYNPYMVVPPPPPGISPSAPKDQGLSQLVSARPSLGEVPSSIPRRDLKSLFRLLPFPCSLSILKRSSDE